MKAYLLVIKRPYELLYIDYFKSFCEAEAKCNKWFIEILHNKRESPNYGLDNINACIYEYSLKTGEKLRQYNVDIKEYQERMDYQMRMDYKLYEMHRPKTFAERVAQEIVRIKGEVDNGII